MDTPRTEQSSLAAEIESQDTIANNWTDLDANLDTFVYKRPLSAQQQRGIAELAERLYNFMPPSCWKTEANLAAALNVSRRQLRYAKQHLVEMGRVKIEKRPNGKRANPVHTIIKVNPIYHYIEEGMSGGEIVTLDWSLFDNLATKDLNEMPVTELLEFYEKVGFQTIPLHYPKFKRDLVYCSCGSGQNCDSIGKHPILAYKNLDFFEKSTYRDMQSFWDDEDLNYNVDADINYNIGFKVAGYTVIDIDYRKGGHYSLDYLEDELGQLQVSLSVKTGGGKHIYVKDEDIPTGVKVNGLSGIDIRSRGEVQMSLH